MELGGIISYNGEKFDWLFGYHFRDSQYIENKAFTDNIYKMYGVDVDKNSEKSVLYTTLCGIYYSPDSEKIYQKYTKIVEDENETRYTTTGLDVQTTYSVKQDPFDKNHLLLPSTDLGLIGSKDNGETWFELKEGIPKKWRNTVYDVEFDKTKNGTIYSLWSSRHDVPYTTVGDEYYATYGGLAISFDGGNTWDAEYSTGLPENAIPYKMQIVYGENNTKTIYVATFNEGFFVSYDSGKTFEEMNEGIQGIDYEGHNLIYATDLECVDGKIFGIIARSTLNDQEISGKVYEFENGKWEEIKLPEEVICPRDVYYHNETLYISSTADIKWDNSVEGVDYKNIGGGILTYKDGIITRIYDETSSIAGVQIDSNGNLYANDIFGNIYLKNEKYDFEKIYSDYHWISKGIILQDDETMYLPSFGGGLLKINISFE